MTQPKPRRHISDFVTERRSESMESLSQDHDDQELLDQQLHDTLFGHINDAPSLESGLFPQEQTQFDDDLFFQKMI